MLFWLFIILNLLVVESVRKNSIRQFVKGKSISNSGSVENILDKRLKIEVQPAQTDGVKTSKGEAFYECPFALHCQQSEKGKQNFDVSILPWKNFCGRP